LRRLLLIGEYDLSIDEKGRLTIPSEIRKSLVPERDGEGFIVALGMNGRPWLYPEQVFEDLVFPDDDGTPGNEELDFAHANYGLASRVAVDSQGRATNLEKMLRRTQTGREVTLVGSRNHLEIWNRVDWEKRRDEELIPRIGEVAIRAKKARQQEARMTPPPEASNGSR